MMPPSENLDARWTAVVRSDARWDGTFFYGVHTTGIFCRPSCRARTPRRENVSFYPTPDAARADGLRACRRCRPEADRESEWLWAFRALESETPPSLSVLAARAGVSESQFRRRFKALVGVTPKQYALRHRAERVASSLPQAPSVSAAVYDAGYGAASRFYASGAPRHGMRASALRRGGEGERIRFSLVSSALGPALVAATDQGVCAVLLERPNESLRAQLAARFPRAECVEAVGDAGFRSWVTAALAVLEGKSPSEALPLDVRATAFQEQVWRELRCIEPGTTTSYSALAAQLGRPGAARAVAGAVARNPLAVVIPCHRVLGRDGSLRGYRWGIDLKRRLLAREALDGTDDPEPSAAAKRAP